MYFYVPVIAFVAGALARSFAPLPAALIAAVAIAGGAALLMTRLRANPSAVLCGIALVAIACGMARAALAPHALPGAFAPLLDAHAELEGIVTANPDLRETGARITVRVAKDGAATKVLAVAPRDAAVQYGDRVRISGTLAAPEAFAGDDGRTFAYDDYLAKDGIFALMQPARVSVIGPPSLARRPVRFLYALTAAFARGLDAALPSPESGLAQGILTGGKQELGKALLAAFTAAGIVQIVVLSGYNVMIVAEMIAGALSFLPRRASTAAAVLGIAAFVIAAGSGASAVRAGVMACLALYARASGRVYSVLRALAFTIALVALWNPFTIAFDPSFQLSAIATYGLVLGVPVIEPLFGWIGSAALREALVTTIAAEAAVLPLLLWQTGNFSLVSIPANTLVSFIVPGAMAASAAAGFAGMALPAAFARLAGVPAFALLWVIVHGAERAAALPFAQVGVPAFPFALVVVAYAAEGWLAWRAYLRKRAPASAGALLLPSATPARAGIAPRTPPS